MVGSMESWVHPGLARMAVHPVDVRRSRVHQATDADVRHEMFAAARVRDTDELACTMQQAP